MIGGVYLCYEGTEKVFEKLVPHHAHAHERALASVALDPKTLEDEKVAGAIKTDFILSAEIMAIALASIPDSNVWTQAFVLVVVAGGITAGVYGVVALIVKADDVGVALAKNTSGPPLGALGRVLGYGLVAGMPVLLKLLSIVGTAAMIWVGGGIIVHGMETYGLTAIGHAIHHAAEISAHALTPIAAMAEWLVTAIGYGIVGLAIGALAIPLMGFVVGPTWRSLKGWLRPRRVVMPTLAMAIVCLAAFLLYRTLSNYSLEDLKAALAGIPAKRIGLMILFAAASYLCLTGFDWLALRYVRRDVPYPRVALASFCSLSLGHNIGFAALSSGAIRYRFYTRWGASAGDVAKIIVFCGMTVGWGLAVLGGCASLLRPELAARITGLPQGAMILLGAALLALAALYLALPFLRQKPLQVWKWRIEVPSFRLAIGQLVIGPRCCVFCTPRRSCPRTRAYSGR